MGLQRIADVKYMGDRHTSVALARSADTELVVEDVKLRVHSIILAANSKVFADMLDSVPVQQEESENLLQVPLPGDSLKDIRTALRYLYKGCTLFSDDMISSPADAISPAKFAHKYEHEALLQACNCYLHTALVLETQGMAEGKRLLASCATLTQLTNLAETCGMRMLLAECENFMVNCRDSHLWTDPAMLSNHVSRRSLLRMLASAQAYGFGATPNGQEPYTTASLGRRHMDHGEKQSHFLRGVGLMLMLVYVPISLSIIMHMIIKEVEL